MANQMLQVAILDLLNTKDNWFIVVFIFGLFWGFVTQVWTPLIELKQRIGVLEKTVDKHDSLIEQIKNNTNYQNPQIPPQIKNTPTISSTPTSNE
jgi:hypothetical protein